MSTERKTVTLRSHDMEYFEVDFDVACECQTLKAWIKEEDPGEFIPIYNVTGDILSMVIEYCKKHVGTPKSGNEETTLRAWDADFVNVNFSILCNLLMAADYLYVKGLLNLTNKTVADLIRGKSPNEIRRMLNMEDDLTPEEEEEIRREYRWGV